MRILECIIQIGAVIIALGFCSTARQAHAGPTLVLVDRIVSRDGITDVMTERGRIALVREAVPSLLASGLFNMPPRYRLSTVHSALSGLTNFKNALRLMKCGTTWRKEAIPKDDVNGPLGQWRSFHTPACARSEIVSASRVIYQGVEVSRNPVILVTHVGD